MNESSFSDYMRASAAAVAVGLCCGAPAVLAAVYSGRVEASRVIEVVGTAIAIALVIYGLVRWWRARTSRAVTRQRAATMQD